MSKWYRLLALLLAFALPGCGGGEAVESEDDQKTAAADTSGGGGDGGHSGSHAGDDETPKSHDGHDSQSAHGGHDDGHTPTDGDGNSSDGNQSHDGHDSDSGHDGDEKTGSGGGHDGDGEGEALAAAARFAEKTPVHVRNVRLEEGELRGQFYVVAPIVATEVFWAVESVGSGRRKFDFEITEAFATLNRSTQESDTIRLPLELRGLKGIGAPPWQVHVDAVIDGTRRTISNAERTDMETDADLYAAAHDAAAALAEHASANSVDRPDAGDAGAVPAKPTAREGTPEWTVQYFILQLAAGKQDALAEHVSVTAKETLGDLRDGKLDEAELERIKGVVGRVQLAGAKTLSSGSRQFTLRNESGQMIQLTLRKYKGNWVVVSFDPGG